MTKAVSIKFVANTAAFRAGVKTVKAGLSGVAKAAKVAGAAIKSATVVLGAFAAAGAVFNLGFGGIKLAADFEKAQVAFGVLLGDMEEGRRLLKDIDDYSMETPFNTQDFEPVVRQLLLIQDKLGGTGGVMDMMKRIGDIGAVLGKQVMPDITRAFVKAMSSGNITAEIIDPLAERGIPILKELGDILGVADTSVRKLVSEGRVSVDDFAMAFRNVTNASGKMFGGMNKASDTFYGKLSTLVGMWGKIRRIFAEPILDALKKTLDAVTERVASLESLAGKVGKAVGKWAMILANAFAEGGFLNLIKAGLSLAYEESSAILKKNIVWIGSYLTATMDEVGFSLVKSFTSASGTFLDMVDYLKSSMEIIAIDFYNRSGLAKLLQDSDRAYEMRGKIVEKNTAKLDKIRKSYKNSLYSLRNVFVGNKSSVKGYSRDELSRRRANEASSAYKSPTLDESRKNFDALITKYKKAPNAVGKDSAVPENRRRERHGTQLISTIRRIASNVSSIGGKMLVGYEASVKNISDGIFSQTSERASLSNLAKVGGGAAFLNQRIQLSEAKKTNNLLGELIGIQRKMLQTRAAVNAAATFQ